MAIENGSDFLARMAYQQVELARQIGEPEETLIERLKKDGSNPQILQMVRRLLDKKRPIQGELTAEEIKDIMGHN